MRIPLLLTFVMGLAFSFSQVAMAQKPAKQQAKVSCCTLKSDSEFISSINGVAHMSDKTFVVKYLTQNGWKRTSFLPAKYTDWCYDYDTPATYRRVTILQDSPDDKDFHGIMLYDIDTENVAGLWKTLESMGYKFVRTKKVNNMKSLDNGPFTQNVYYFTDDKGVCAMIYDDEFDNSDLYTLSVYFQHLYK